MEWAAVTELSKAAAQPPLLQLVIVAHVPSREIAADAATPASRETAADAATTASCETAAHAATASRETDADAATTASRETVADAATTASREIAAGATSRELTIAAAAFIDVMIEREIVASTKTHFQQLLVGGQMWNQNLLRC